MILNDKQAYALAAQLAEILVQHGGVTDFLWAYRNKQLMRLRQQFGNEPFSTDDLREAGLTDLWYRVRNNPKFKTCWIEMPKNKQKRAKSKTIKYAKTWKLVIPS